MHNSSRAQRYPLQYGATNPILRTQTSPADLSDLQTHEVIQALTELIHEYDGVGLAAPQIGQDMRIIAITKRDPKGKKMRSRTPIILINPKITYQSDDTTIREEGCLSLPNLYGDVERPTSVSVTYTDPSGNEQTADYTGFMSTIVQHEIDHLDGILFIDKLV